MSTAGKPLLSDQEHYRGERVVQTANIDIDDVADKTSSQLWCRAICLSVMAPFCAPLFCFLSSPCGAEDRVRRSLFGPRPATPVTPSDSHLARFAAS